MIYINFLFSEYILSSRLNFSITQLVTGPLLFRLIYSQGCVNYLPSFCLNWVSYQMNCRTQTAVKLVQSFTSMVYVFERLKYTSMFKLSDKWQSISLNELLRK